jgi:hypothetical protein
MILIAPTSALNYLVRIGCIDALPGLYGPVICPAGCFRRAPGRKGAAGGETMGASLPAWPEVRRATGAPGGGAVQKLVGAGFHASLALIRLFLDLHARRLGRHSGEDVS